MTDAVEKPLNRRQQAKARTKAKILAVAGDLFRSGKYHEATIRSIAKAAGMSTGAVFANWDSKADLWREIMGCEPPGDTPVTRAAPQLLSALSEVVATVWGEDLLHAPEAQVRAAIMDEDSVQALLRARTAIFQATGQAVTA